MNMDLFQFKFVNIPQGELTGVSFTLFFHFLRQSLLVQTSAVHVGQGNPVFFYLDVLQTRNIIYSMYI